MAASLTPKEHHQLKRFVRLVDEMRRCRFISAYCANDQAMGAGIDENGVEWRKNPTYDEEDLRSFLTLYRQVGYAKNDKESSVNLEHILDLVDTYADQDLKAKTAQVRSATLPLMKGEYSAIRFAKVDDDFKPVKSVTSFETLKTLMNGYIFHPDKKHAETLEFLEADGSELWMYFFPVMDEIVVPTLKGCLFLFHALREHGILADGDFPARCFGPPPTASRLREAEQA
jgi:hypothetical protein